MAKLWMIDQPDGDEEITEIVFAIDKDNDTVSLIKAGNVSCLIKDSFTGENTISFSLLNLEKALTKAKELGWY